MPPFCFIWWLRLEYCMRNFLERAWILQRLARLYLKDRRAFELVQRVRREKLSYLETAALLDLYDAVSQIEAQHLDGIVVEAGTAKGGSSLVMSAAKRPERSFYMFDAFGLIPPPSDKDGIDAHERYELIASGEAIGTGGQLYYGYEENLEAKVRDAFERYDFEQESDSLHFVKGLYEDTFRINEPVALAHIDCDWYDSVMICLQETVPNLVESGVIVIDDYEAWSGCRRAVDDYFADQRGDFNFVMKSRLHIIRKLQGK